MPFNSAPLNPDEPMVTKELKPTKTFIAWVTPVVADIDAAPARLASPIARVAQNASIGTSPIGTPDSDGLYRVSYSVQVTAAAGVSSSIQVSFAWTRNSVSQAFTGTAFTGNTTGTNGSQTQLIRSDGASPISYSITYASNPAGAMQYALDIVLEQVSA